MSDPIQQFDIKSLARFGHLGGHEIAFTNPSAFMLPDEGAVTSHPVVTLATAAVVFGRLRPGH